MTAPKSHIIKSAVFTPTTGTAVTFTGLQGADITVSGQRHTWSGDGAATVQAQSMEDIEAQATVTTTDLSFAGDAALKIGTAGSLAIVFSPRGPRGAASGGDVTRTMGDAIVESVAPSGPHRGESTLTVTFSGVSASASNDPVS